MIDQRTLRNFHLPIIAGAFVVTTTIGLLIAQQASLADKNQQRKAFESQITMHEQKLTALARMEAELTDLRQQQHQSVSSNGLAMGQLLQQLGQDMINAGALERQVTTGTVRKLMQWEITPVNISFHGTFSTVEQFLRKVEGYAIMIRPEHIAIQRDTSTKEGHLKVSIDLAALRLADARGTD